MLNAENLKINSDKYPTNYPTPPDKLNNKKLSLILKKELQQWTVVKSPLPENPTIIREELNREFVFKDFSTVLEFMSKVAVVCNTLPHHPRWENTWTTLNVYLSTWDNSHIISYTDIMLARHMEAIYKEFDQYYINYNMENWLEEETKTFFSTIEKLRIKGNLEEVFNKLNQYISQPKNIKNRAKIGALIKRHETFTGKMRTHQLTKIEIKEEINDIDSILAKITEPEATQIPKLFFSYAWGEEREKIVDDLYDSLKKDEMYELVRDKINLGYKGLISEFMRGIGKGNFVILALSDKYLRSEYCMFELYELYRNSCLDSSQFLTKIYPVSVEKIDLNDAKVLREYFSYWKNLESEWRDLVNEFNADQKKYRMIQAINYSLPILLPLLNDINSMTKEILSNDDFAVIKKAIRTQVSNVKNHSAPI